MITEAARRRTRIDMRSHFEVEDLLAVGVYDAADDVGHDTGNHDTIAAFVVGIARIDRNVDLWSARQIVSRAGRLTRNTHEEQGSHAEGGMHVIRPGDRMRGGGFVPYPPNLPSGLAVDQRLLGGGPLHQIVGSKEGALLLSALVLSGCIGRDMGSTAIISSRGDTDMIPPIVIALVDTGVNPYRPIFSSDDAAVRDLATSLGARTLPIATEGDYETRVEHDGTIWNATEPDRLYWFEGTRLFGISVRHDLDGPPYIRDRDAFAHGTLTAHLAAREAPGAVIVAVQIDASCDMKEGCVAPPDLAIAMDWIADQDWIDVVSTSIGLPGNPPDSGVISEDTMRVVAATRRAAESGKILVNGAGNTVAPSVQSPINGPPWLVAVGGFQHAARGEASLAAKSIDVVSNFTEYVPRRETVDELTRQAGTSLATPIVAATLATALALVRAAGVEDEETPARLRAALNATGIYFAPTDWDPSADAPTNGTIDDVIAAASTPILVQPQMGWGYVNASHAPEIARRVIENDLGVPGGKEQAALFQTRWQQAREEYWKGR